MMSMPELKRLTIISFKFQVQVQVITFKQHRTLSSLEFEHSSPASAFSNLSPEVLSSKLYALVYELPSKAPSTVYGDLEALLIKDDHEYGVGVLHDKANNYSNVYLMLHQKTKGSLAAVVNGSKLAIFKLSYNDLLGNNLDNLVKYLYEETLFSSELIRSNEEYDRELKRFEKDLNEVNRNVSNATEKNGRLMKRIVTARNLIKNLAEECRNDGDVDTTLCIYCRVKLKQVLFLPCGHVVCCKDCVVRFGNLTLDLSMGKQRVKCPRCKKIVGLVKEVFY